MITRREAIASFATVAASAALLSAPPPALAQAAAPPTVDTANPQEVADGVWVIPDRRVWLVPNIGIILGRDAALVVDVGLGPANGERVLDLARRLAGPRRLMVTITHFHPEHGYGAQVFQPDATIIYNRAQRDELVEKGDRFLGMFRDSQGPAAVAALDGTRIVLPHLVYDGPTAEIDLGGRRVELRNWGAAHSRGDQVVYLPQERILFAGDLAEEGMFPIFPWIPPVEVDADAARWLRILREFERLDPALLVPGHGAMGTAAIARVMTGHIETVGRRVGELRRAGRTADQIVAEVKPELIRAHPQWGNSDYIDLMLRYFEARPI